MTDRLKDGMTAGAIGPPILNVLEPEWLDSLPGNVRGGGRCDLAIAAGSAAFWFQMLPVAPYGVSNLDPPWYAEARVVLLALTRHRCSVVTRSVVAAPRSKRESAP